MTDLESGAVALTIAEGEKTQDPQLDGGTNLEESGAEAPTVVESNGPTVNPTGANELLRSSDTFSSKVLTAIKNKVDYSLITKSSPSSTLNQLGSHTRLDSQQVLESPTPTQEEAPTCTKIARAVQVLSCAPRRLRSPNKYLEPPEDRLEVCRKVHLDQGDEAKFLEESDSDLAHLR